MLSALRARQAKLSFLMRSFRKRRHGTPEVNVFYWVRPTKKPKGSALTGMRKAYAKGERHFLPYGKPPTGSTSRETRKSGVPHQLP
jgi:hypothetical protein